MRTTVDLDEDILQVAKHLAQQRKQSLGRVLSDLVRQGLQPARQAAVRRGAIPTLPRKPGARPVTDQIVKELLEAEILGDANSPYQ
ncbi:MAG: CopG family transcriptional regulator [Bryobacteraceae bacterium]